jgi:hypothetical protein
VACHATIPVPDKAPLETDLDWDTDFSSHYVKGKLIGQGSFGSVYLGIDLHTGQQVGCRACGMRVLPPSPCFRAAAAAFARLTGCS